MACRAVISDDFEPGDVVLGDRGFCSFAHLAVLVGRGLHAVFRVHQIQIVDFTPGRPAAPPRHRANPGRLPHSRWVLAHGPSDQVVAWPKPKSRPAWMAERDFAALHGEVAVRELRYRVDVPGYRTAEVTPVTTLLEASAYTAAELAGLYLRRWQADVNIKHMKITMNIDVLRELSTGRSRSWRCSRWRTTWSAR